MSSLSLLFGGSSTQVGEMVFLPSDKPLITNATREFLRSGVITKNIALYPDFPSWLTQPADGVIWTQRFLPASASWQSITYGNGVFVAVTYNSLIAATSPDGITWTQRVLPASANWQSITYGNGVFVAVVESGSTIAATSDTNEFVIGSPEYTPNLYLRVK